MLQASIRSIRREPALARQLNAAPLAFPEEVKVADDIEAAHRPTNGHLPLISSTAHEFEKY
jgi:hypothetical protein